MNYEMLDKIVGSLGEASNNPMSGEGVAWLNEKYGGKEKDSRSLLQKTQDLGNELWNISYAGSALRSIGRAANPSAEYDWRKEKLDEWIKNDWYLANNEYQISPEEQNAWLNTPARPTPEGVLQGKADRKREEEAFIKSQGGYFNTIVKSIAEDPTGFAINLAKGIIADPELLGLPSIYKSGAAAVLKQLPNATRTAELAGGAAEVAVGAGIIAGGEAIQSEEQTGSMDFARVKQGAMLGAGMGAVAAVAQGFMRAVGRAGKLAETKTGVDSKEVQARI